MKNVQKLKNGKQKNKKHQVLQFLFKTLRKK